MSIFLRTKYPSTLQSKFDGPPILNFAGAGDGSGGGSSDDDDDPDAPPADTPAGQKWRKMRSDKKAAEAAAQAERDEKLKAQAKAEALEEAFAKLDPTKRAAAAGGKEDEEEAENPPEGTNPDDAQYVEKLVAHALKKQGLNPGEIKEALKDIKETQQSSQISQTLKDAKSELTAEFADSVPFDYEAALKYARDRGYGVIASNATEALRLAHKQMNEARFIEYYQKGGKKDGPKKEVPSLDASGSGSRTGVEGGEDDLDEKIDSLEDARSLAKSMLGADDEEE